MSKTLAADSLLVGFVQGTIAVDPSVGAGVVAGVGAILPRLGTPELWQKFGAADTDWRIVGHGGNYAAGPIIVPSGTYRILCNHLVLTTSLRVTLQGTGRLTIKT